MAEDHRQSEAAAAERISPTNTANKSRFNGFLFYPILIPTLHDQAEKALLFARKMELKTKSASNASWAHNALVGNLSQALLNA